MLEWKVVTAEEKFADLKRRTEQEFDDWFNAYWASRCSRDTMLSPESPLPHVYATMCLPAEDAKLICPYNYYEVCSDCGGKTDIWLETSFSSCDEYGCGMSLCPDCVRKLKAEIQRLDRRADHDLARKSVEQEQSVPYQMLGKPGLVGIKGLKGPIAECPRCGAKSPTWDPDSDVRRCTKCGWDDAPCDIGKTYNLLQRENPT